MLRPELHCFAPHLNETRLKGNQISSQLCSSALKFNQEMMRMCGHCIPLQPNTPPLPLSSFFPFGLTTLKLKVLSFAVPSELKDLKNTFLLLKSPTTTVDDPNNSYVITIILLFLWHRLKYCCIKMLKPSMHRHQWQCYIQVCYLQLLQRITLTICCVTETKVTGKLRQLQLL